MTLGKCVKWGAAGGVVGGLFFSAGFAGAAERHKHNPPRSSSLMNYSFASLAGGSLIGAVGGAGYYGLNRGVTFLRTSTHSTKFAAAALVSSAIAKGIHLGTKEK